MAKWDDASCAPKPRVAFDSKPVDSKPFDSKSFESKSFESKVCGCNCHRKSVQCRDVLALDELRTGTGSNSFAEMRRVDER
jgi:hypothetical protein